MGDIIGAIFGGGDKKSQPAGPSAEEVEEKEKLKNLTDSKNRRESEESATRNKIITSNAAGPQTLFTRPGSIPKPVKLGVGKS